MGKEKARTLRLTAEAFLLVLLLFALLGAAFVLFPGSFAWLSRNRDVGAGGMQVKVAGAEVTVTYYRAVGEGDFLPLASPEEMLEGLLPGDSVRLKAEYTSLAE
jgi:hypothetical protein